MASIFLGVSTLTVSSILTSESSVDEDITKTVGLMEIFGYKCSLKLRKNAGSGYAYVCAYIYIYISRLIIINSFHEIFFLLLTYDYMFFLSY